MMIDVFTYHATSPKQWGELGTHIDPRGLGADAGAHDRAMSVVDGAIVHGICVRRFGAHIPAEVTADFIRERPDTRHGTVGIDPLDPGWRTRLRHARDLGLKGVTISPALSGFHPAHTKAMRLYESCQGQGLPVFIAATDPLPAAADLSFQQPHLLDEVARTFPALKIVITACGGPFWPQTLALVAKHPHVYADLSGVVGRPMALQQLLWEATANGAVDGLFLASAYPASTPEDIVEAVYSINTMTKGTLQPPIPRRHLQAIIERDPLPLLGLPPLTSASRSPTEEPSPMEELDV